MTETGAIGALAAHTLLVWGGDISEMLSDDT